MLGQIAYPLGTCKLDLFHVNITVCRSIVASVVPAFGLFICQMLSCSTQLLSLTQERHRAVGADPEEIHEDDQRAGTPLL